MLLRKDRKKLLLSLLRDARLDAGLRQEDVAAHVGRPQSYIAKIENGERKVDFIEVIEICAAVGLDPITLVRRFK